MERRFVQRCSSCTGPSSARGRGRDGGFTLLELLVVSAIIALLLGILLPALGAARQQARCVVCLSNLRQWGMGVNLYAQEYRGFLPRRGNGWQPVSMIHRTDDWFNALPGYFKSRTYYDLALDGQIPRPGKGKAKTVWLCPEAVDGGGKFFLSYGMNMALSTWDEVLPDNLNGVGLPGSMVFLADGIGSYCSALPSIKAYSPVIRHGKKVNLGFLDGHAASYDGAYVGCGVGDPKRDEVRWYVPGSKWGGPP